MLTLPPHRFAPFPAHRSSGIARPISMCPGSWSNSASMSLQPINAISLSDCIIMTTVVAMFLGPTSPSTTSWSSENLKGKNRVAVSFSRWDHATISIAYFTRLLRTRRKSPQFLMDCGTKLFQPLREFHRCTTATL